LTSVSKGILGWGRCLSKASTLARADWIPSSRPSVEPTLPQRGQGLLDPRHLALSEVGESHHELLHGPDDQGSLGLLAHVLEEGVDGSLSLGRRGVELQRVADAREPRVLELVEPTDEVTLLLRRALRDLPVRLGQGVSQGDEEARCPETPALGCSCSS
jgi:hypothetical protein